jgi:uncharacterized Fe-S cluster-containing protein
MIEKINCSVCGKEECDSFSEGRSRGFCSRIDDFAPRQGQNDQCFMAGWKVGRKEIDAAADEAFQSYYSMG